MIKTSHALLALLKKDFPKILTIFVIGLITRYLINHYLDINVFSI